MPNKQVQTDHELVRNLPVVDFYYPGHHSHPVRRTCLLIKGQQHPLYFKAYELREGAVTRSYAKAPIKTYRRSRVSKIGQLDKRRVMRRDAATDELNNTTLRRRSLLDLVRRVV